MTPKVLKKVDLAGMILDVKDAIACGLSKDGVVILPPMEVDQTLQLMKVLGFRFETIMLDPWYNKGFGGQREDYLDFCLNMITNSGNLSEHVFFWGFPEIVAPFVERIPKPLELVCWLTWYYKNNPSVIRGWRSSQNACLHMSKPGARLYPERFLNEKQLALKEKGKLRYMPGPTSVIEAGPTDVIEEALLVGFVGRKEQTGHPSQKPFRVFEQLLKMTVSDGGMMLDPLCGSGTAGEVSMRNGYLAILCDVSDEYTSLTETRLQVKRLSISDSISAILNSEIDQ